MQKIPKNLKMSFNGQANMFILHVYFLDMWLASKVRHFEPIEHNFFIKWFLKMCLLPCNPFFQNFKTLKFMNDLVFHQVHPMNTYFHGGACFCCIIFLKSIAWFYAYLLITFKKMYFKLLIPLVYKT
jgi:hypothetical protein